MKRQRSSHTDTGQLHPLENRNQKLNRLAPDLSLDKPRIQERARKKA